MRTQILTVALLAFCLSLSSNVAAQGTGVNAPGYKVAVLDIAKVFQSHERLKAEKNAMQKRAKQVDTELKSDGDAIRLKEKERNEQFKVGSAGYNKIDNSIAAMKANLQLKMRHHQKQFMQSEASLFYQTYTEVQKAVAYYSQMKKIGVVFRYSSAVIDPAKPREMMQRIDRNIIIYHDKIDITGDIIAIINNRSGGAPANIGSLSGRGRN